MRDTIGAKASPAKTSSSGAFSSRFQRGDIFCGEPKVHPLVEKLGGLRWREAQIGGAQFGQLAPHAQAGQRELRILSGSDDQLHVRRQVIE